MTRQEAREEINSRLEKELKIAPKESYGYPTYICPVCGNGSGDDGTGICTRNGKHYMCFICGTYGDYLNFLKTSRKVKSEKVIFDEYDLDIDGEMSEAELATELAYEAQTPDEAKDYYFFTAHIHLSANTQALEYVQSRGISFNTARRFMLGYVPKWQGGYALGDRRELPPSKRIIIPTGPESYIARAIDDTGPARFRSMNEGGNNIFNIKALHSGKPVYVTEGPFDALSVIEAGGEAIALGGTGNLNAFISMCRKDNPKGPLILALDNDDTGRRVQEAMKDSLRQMKIPYYEINIAGKYKDANEHLVANRDDFFNIISCDLDKAAELVDEIIQRVSEEDKAEYLASSAAYQIDALQGVIDERANTPPILTGFGKLDAALGGGLYEGLYVIGAISSAGKTSWVLQVADQIAKNGHDVIIFSLEMSQYELMAKSISRLSFELCDGWYDNAKSTRDILDGAKRESFTEKEMDLIDRSIEAYREYSNRIYIKEAIGNIGAKEIRDTVDMHIRCAGTIPVVVIDFLQIMAEMDVRATDKQNIDRAVSELKRLSRDKKIPILAVSSFNRENYNAPVNLASFKESGAIEYSSDVLLGLQLRGMDELSQGESKRVETLKKISEMKEAYPRKLELKVLKNRNGKAGDNLSYDFYCDRNFFKEGSIFIENIPDGREQLIKNRKRK